MENVVNAGDEAPMTAFDLRHHADRARQHDRLTAWFEQVLGPHSSPAITFEDDSVANGMSSSTLLFGLDFNENGRREHRDLVARLAPDANDIAVFPTYDLQAQFDTMATVSACTQVPVPRLRWIEPTGEPLGQPFFIMDRVSGFVPPDMLPYTFGDNWLFDASHFERANLQRSMITVLAALHRIEDAPARFTALAESGAPEGFLQRHLNRTRHWYDWSVASNGVRSALMEHAFARLGETIPPEPESVVLSWGDARIGNVLFAAFEPIAILDWEMADLGPRELDVTWLCYSHRVFQDLATGLGMAGLPDFLTIDDVFDDYTAITGHPITDPQWHLLYAAVRWGCAFLRTGARAAFLEGTEPDPDGDNLLHNRTSLSALIEGTFEPRGNP